MSKFEFISRTIKSCITPDHFATAKGMLSNFQDATREEKVKLLQEFETERIKRGVYSEHIELPLSVNFSVYVHNQN